MSTHSKVRSFILSNLVNKDNRMVGVEEECILYNEIGRRIPVNSGDEFSAAGLLNIMNENADGNGIYSLEPGGQLEWSSPPFASLNDLEKAMLSHHALLDEVVSENNLKIIDYGLDPITSPENIDLIDQKKYQLMNNCLLKNGTMGQWMMRNTASIQINFDTMNKKELEEMVFVADCLHPIAAYLFANSPYQEGKPTGLKNIRNIIWENTDYMRCRNLFDHGIVDLSELIDKYINYVFQVPSIFKLDRSGSILSSDEKIGEVLEELNASGSLNENDIQAALHQIFTNVRIKNLVEIRGADRTPRGYEMAPVAFWTGILMEENVRNEAKEVLVSWTKKDRELFNNAGLSLDSDQPGPQGKDYITWIHWGAELAMTGLGQRNKNEVNLFEDFYNKVSSLGPFSLQAQNHGSTHNT